VNGQPLLRLLRVYGLRHSASYLGGGAALFLTNLLSVEIPVQIGAAIDQGAGSAGPHILAVAGMGVGVIAVRTLSRVLIFNPGRDVERDLRADLFRFLLRQQPTAYATRTTGDLISRATNDITYVRALVGYGLMAALNVVMAVGLTGWKMLSLSPLLTLAAVAPVLVGLVVVRWGIGEIHRLSRQSAEQLGALSEHVLSSFQGVATIQGFVAERAFLQRFDDSAEALFATRMRSSMVGSLAFPALALAGSVSVFMVLYVGGPLAVRGDLSVGEVAAFTTLLGVLLPPLRSLGWMLSVLQTGIASLIRIFEVLDTPIDRPEGAQPQPIAAGAPGFSLHNLSFAYPDAPDHPVLEGISVEIPPGSVVGVFGQTGSGKSTLLRLLSRLYNPPEGAVTLLGRDGSRRDLRSVDLDAWRGRLAMAPQRPFLFSDTIRENVALTDPIDEASVQRAVDIAALGPDLAALSGGLDTVVGERGVMLSGGQRQRVALARALSRPADLVLLDDVLSAVDHHTEARLVETLSALADSDGGRPTQVIVSHRVSAIRHADIVLVLHQGRLVDQGRPAELLARPGPFLEAALAQTPKDDVEVAR